MENGVRATGCHARRASEWIRIAANEDACHLNGGRSNKTERQNATDCMLRRAGLAGHRMHEPRPHLLAKTPPTSAYDARCPALECAGSTRSATATNFDLDRACEDAGAGSEWLDSRRRNQTRSLASNRRASLGQSHRFAREHGSLSSRSAQMGERPWLPLCDRQRREHRRRPDLRRPALEETTNRRALQSRCGALLRPLARDELLQRKRHRSLPDRQLREVVTHAQATRRTRKADAVSMR